MTNYTTIQVSKETRDLLNSIRDRYGYDNVELVVKDALSRSTLREA